MEQKAFLQREELAQAHQLGALQKEYTIRFRRSLTQFGIGMLIAMLIATMISLYLNRDVFELTIIVLIFVWLVIIVLVGGIMLGLYSYYRHLHIYVHTDGLLCLNGNKSWVARWKDIKKAYYYQGSFYMRAESGTSFTIPGAISGFGELKSTIEREVAKYVKYPFV